ncbi:hypothetical protein A1O3_06661 [Capronia epimyces CBS 606.96]|uniref:Phosphoglycerate mutase n=1 Tax=Capronia epimyces CBS 606.96 TaxID=1182542 RepID=W9Y0W8_9EURO|nr:uncharacterized protein A1O3_06661 [Capronia epimyces CBS 606.96]EXJ82846.1 hypothetical protein A1O3_06661 [Capronia epimyces CBS 606.96]
MGKQPAVVFIARHGARLDQADRNWHTTAEDPHDPPLTYGGWVQCQTLGVRISNELHNLDQQHRSGVDKDNTSADPRPPKRRKVIIHSSPYLRCVQTAVAICAGIQHPQNHRRPGLKARQRSNLSPLDPPPEVTSPPVDTDQDVLQRTTSQDPLQTNRLGYNTCLLRIDAFLGEWLSPSYFDHISPPPPSPVLMSQAKQTLQKPQEEIKAADMSPSSTYDLPSMDWEEKENEATSVPTPERAGLRAMAAVGHSLPKRPRNVSFGTELANGARLLNRNLHRQPLGYSPPVPMYAMGASDKIPPGFVAHARDCCVVVDHSWDSQNNDLDWGDGGSFGEEWGSMHRRFRNGVQRMIAHYEGKADERQEPDGLEEDEELVLVLVTHQAGCNALIRLFTGAPALHDVGPASLTMAVRKQDRQAPYPPVSPSDSLDMVVSGDFEMRLIASTEHLRGGSNPLGPNSPRLGKSPAFASRRAVGADSPEGFALGESLNHRPSTSSLGRSTSQRAHAADASSDLEPPTGLWRRGSRYSRDETTESSEAVVTPSMQSVGAPDDIPEEPLESTSNEHEEKADADRPLPVRSASQLGLWGTESTTVERSPGKRRWTAGEGLRST